MKQEKLNSLLTNRNPEEMDCYLGETFSKQTQEEVIFGLLCLRLPEEIAARRAPMVTEDMAAIRFPLRLEVQRGLSGWLHERGLRIPIQYKIADTRHSIDHQDTNQALEGSHLTQGDLVRLSKACEIGRSILPNEWPQRFAGQLRNPREHLDSVNELWWLGRFNNPENVDKSDKKSNKRPSPDWSFTVSSGESSLRLNVEVKRRCSDIKRHLAFSEKTNLFDKISPKFRCRSLTELNVAAVTTYSSIDNTVEEMARRWIENEENIDAVVIWSEQSSSSPALVAVTREEISDLFRTFLSKPDAEDISGVGMISHVIRDLSRFPSVK